MNQQEASKTEEYNAQTLYNERREWNKLTQELYAQIDTLTDQLTTANRQKDEAIDTLSATQEARYNAESTYTETILDRNAEIEQLKADLTEAREACQDLDRENVQLKEERDIYLKALVQMGNGWEELLNAIKAIKAITGKIYTD